MSTSRILVYDPIRDRHLPSAPDGSVLLTSDHANLDGIIVEHHKIEPWEMEPHIIEGHRLVINIGRPVEFEWNVGGQWQRRTYQTNSFALQTEGDRNQPRWHNTFEFISVALDDTFGRKIAGEQALTAPLEFEEQRGQVDNALHRLAVLFRNELSSGVPFGPVYGEALTTAFTMHLLAQYAVQKDKFRYPKGKLDARQLRTIIEFSNDQLTENLTLEQLSEQVAQSPFHFAHTFKNTLGVSPHQYLLTIKVERAKQLMARARLSLTEISQMVGFFDQSHFIHAFKKLTGSTPKGFRKLVIG